jgi:hypothetical protein
MWFLAVALLAGAGFCLLAVLKSRTQRDARLEGIPIKTAAHCSRESGRESRYGSDRKTSERREAVESPEEWWANADVHYFWVVLCKNEKFHRRLNPAHSHRIPLGQTDTVSDQPVSTPFQARCDSCGSEYVYMPSDVMRWEMEAPQSFDPHPLFRD